VAVAPRLAAREEHPGPTTTTHGPRPRAVWHCVLRAFLLRIFGMCVFILQLKALTAYAAH
jgi:hypothetical protein